MPAVNIRPKIFIAAESPGPSIFPDWQKSFRGQVGQKVTQLQYLLVNAVKKKFNNTKLRRPGEPQGYPRRILGEAVNSIRVEDASTDDFVGFTIGTPSGTREGKKIPRLSRGYLIAPKSNKPLAIPLSLEAKQASSAGKGPRQHFGNRLKIYKAGRGAWFLVEMSGGPSQQLESHNREKASQLRGLRGQYIKAIKGAQKHYLLSFAPVRVKPHYGIDTAIEECMPIIASTLGGVWK